jgi:HEPN domain-containing protein
VTNDDVTQSWLSKASDDLDAAMILCNHHPMKLENICFHAQQAAEKALNAVLVDNMVFPNKTHNLGEIVSCVEPYMGDLENLRPKALFLNPYAVEHRYPNELYIDEDTARLAIDYASDIVQRVRRHLRSKQQDSE